VQGVGFRAATADAAHDADLGGWVRNREDGAVEVGLDGPAEDVERLLTWLESGPPGAQVDDVVVEELDGGEPPATRRFEVR
jgi:acylphosphatase